MKQKFTLIELLVVIAIIAILASMLLPALTKARERAKQLKCLTQIKEIGRTMQFYNDDADGYFPNYGKTLKAGNVKIKYADSRNLISTIYNIDWAPYLCATYLNKNAEVFKCPNDQRAIWTLGNNNMSYGYVWWNDSPGGGALHTWNKISRIKKASELIVFAETNGDDFQDGLIIGIWPGGGYGTREPGTPHKDLCNTVFADGHAAAHQKGVLANNAEWWEF